MKILSSDKDHVPEEEIPVSLVSSAEPEDLRKGNTFASVTGTEGVES